MQLDRFKQGRQNCQGDRVDINQLKRMQKLDERQLGAFKGGPRLINQGIIARQANRPMPMMDTEALAKQEKLKKEQEEKYNGYLSQRALKFGAPQNQGPFAK